MVLDSQDGQHPSGLSLEHLETGTGVPESLSSSNTMFAAPAAWHLTSLPTPSHCMTVEPFFFIPLMWSVIPDQDILTSTTLAFSRDPHFCVPVHSSIADDNTNSAILATPFIKPLCYNLFCAATWVIGELDEI